MSIRTLMFAFAVLASASAYADQRTRGPWQGVLPDGSGSGRVGVGEDRNGRCTIFNPAKPSSLGHHHGNGTGC